MMARGKVKVSKVKLNLRGVNAVMKSPGVQADLLRRAERIAAAAGPVASSMQDDGFYPSVVPGRFAARASVITVGFDAMRSQARDRVLSRAIDAGR